MRTSIFLLVSSASLLGVAQANDPNEIILGNLGAGLAGGTAFGSGATTEFKAFSFTMGSADFALTEVVLHLANVSPGADPLLEIWSDAGGIPGSPLIELVDPVLVPGPSDVTFTAGSEFTLAGGVTYWLHLRSEPMDGPAFLWRASNPDTLPTGAGGTSVGYNFNGNPGSSVFNLLSIRGTSEVGTPYCTAVPNSTGQVGTVVATGCDTVSSNDLTLTAANLPNDAFGFFITSQTQGFVVQPGASVGNLCLSGDIGRYVAAGQVKNTGSAGSFSLTLDLTQTPQPTGLVSIASGETWNFQAWHRDALPSGPTSNYTRGLEINFE